MGNPIKTTVTKVKALPHYQWRAWGKNLLKFTAPILAIYFGQLAMGVNWKAALPIALYGAYALIADFFKKINET